MQESVKVSCLSFTAGLVVRAVKSVCFFLLHFPLGRQFSPHSATLAFAEGSSPTTSLQEALCETTFQRVPHHMPQPPNAPCISPCPWGCHLWQPTSRGQCWWALSGLPSLLPSPLPKCSQSQMCCFVLLPRLMLLCL